MCRARFARARAECAHRRAFMGSISPSTKHTLTVTTMKMKIEDRTPDSVSRSDEIVVKRCPRGHARAPDVKRYDQSQFRCVCGHRGTLPYPVLFKLLRRRRKPMRLRCQRCGRVLC